MELFPYQREGAKWLAEKHVALLADEMGLGKSAQAITACDEVRAERVLVLCPASARVNWLREFQKFSTNKRKFTVIERKDTKVALGHSVICSYDLSSELKGQYFDVLILDEAHYLKSLEAKRTKNVFGLSGIVRTAKRIWALTGTPTPNHPGELWVLLYSFGATNLKYPQFVERYCTYYEGPHGRSITGAQTLRIKELREVIKPVILRRKKEEVMRDLPPIHYQHQVVEAGPVDLEMEASFVQYVFPTDRKKELFDTLLKQEQLLQTVLTAVPLDKRKTGQDSLKALEALAKSVSTLRRYTGLQKVKAAAEMVEEDLMFDAYDKVVIFAIHRDVIEGLRIKLARFNPVTLYGNTNPESRVKNIDKFQNNPQCRVFIGNIQAAGVAITLTAAHQVLFVEQSWTPGDNAQAAMRCHRIGQTRPVFVRFLGLANTIDERVSMVLRSKARQISEIFDYDLNVTLPPR